MSLTISELYIYPVKSCAGIAVQAAKLTRTGFEHDREWMLVREGGWFVTQRQYPRMALIQPRVSADGLVLNAPDMPEIIIPILTGGGAKTLEVRVWDDLMTGADQGDEASAWLSKFLDAPVRLVRQEGERPLGNKYQVTGKDNVSFADSFPLLLVSQASLDDLNSRMDKLVPITRFRPNIVVAGGTAFQEDDWRKLQVGGITLHLPKQCSRCEIITIDQKTAIKDIEPMETLSSYRYKTKGIIFGKNTVAEQLKTLHVGDAIDVVE